MNKKQKTKKRNPFLPPEEFMASLDYKRKSQVSLMINGNIGIGLAFAAFSTIVLSAQRYAVGIVATISCILFFSSLAAIKRSKLSMASIMQISGFLIATFVVCFFATNFTTPLIFYRDALFATAMAVMNAYMALGIRQILFYSVPASVIWLIAAFVAHADTIAAYGTESIMQIAICTVAQIIVTAMLILSAKFNKTIIKETSDKEAEASETLDKITKVLEESQEGLDVGNKLNLSADSATEAINSIQELYKSLGQDSLQLNQDAKSATNAGSEINSHAERMKKNVVDQGNSITLTSTSMTQISTNLTSISAIANKRKEGMDDILANLALQEEHITNLVKQMAYVKESSDKILAFVNTVDAIASQTGLLAMNASIEAAHAGTMGKGFSVIAQEIRKLSEETAKNASNIAETLEENGQLVSQVSETAHYVETFTEKSSNEIRTTMNAIEEIIGGISEMNIGAMGIHDALQQLVEESLTTQKLVDDVTDQLTGQERSLQNISGISDNLQQRMNFLKNQLDLIGEAIVEIKTQASQNVDCTTNLAKSLKDIQ